MIVFSCFSNSHINNVFLTVLNSRTSRSSALLSNLFPGCVTASYAFIDGASEPTPFNWSALTDSWAMFRKKNVIRLISGGPEKERYKRDEETKWKCCGHLFSPLHPPPTLLWNPHKELCASKCKLNLKWRHRRRWICRYFVMCGLAGVNLCVLVCDWSTTETGRLIKRIYSPCTSKLGVGQEFCLLIYDRRETRDSHSRGVAAV
jgi:hypothetical protein